MNKLTTQQRYTNSLRVLRRAQLRVQAVRDAWMTGLPFEHVDNDGVDVGVRVTGLESHFKSFQVMAVSTLTQCVNDVYAALCTNQRSQHMGLKLEDYEVTEDTRGKRSLAAECAIKNTLRFLRNKMTAHTDAIVLDGKHNLLHLLPVSIIHAGLIMQLEVVIEEGISICKEKDAEDATDDPLFSQTQLARYLGNIPCVTKSLGERTRFDVVIPLSEDLPWPMWQERPHDA